MKASGWKWLPAAVVGSSTALGVLKTLVEASSGEEVSLNQVAFYLGASVILVYIALAVALLVGGGLGALANTIWGEDNLSTPVQVACFAVGGVAGIGIAAVVISGGVLFDYYGLDTLGRVAFSVIGIIALIGTIYLWYLLTHLNQSDTQVPAAED